MTFSRLYCVKSFINLNRLEDGKFSKKHGPFGQMKMSKKKKINSFWFVKNSFRRNCAVGANAEKQSEKT